jgi:hypothetical protein
MQRYHVSGAVPLLGLVPAPAEVAPPGSIVAVMGRTALRILEILAPDEAVDSIGRFPDYTPELVVNEQADVRQGSRLGRAYGMNDVKWGYGGSLPLACFF